MRATKTEIKLQQWREGTEIYLIDGHEMLVGLFGSWVLSDVSDGTDRSRGRDTVREKGPHRYQYSRRTPTRTDTDTATATASRGTFGASA